MNNSFYKSIIISLLTTFIGIILSINSYGAYLRNIPMKMTQPDGTIINCFATGDEFYNWLHDADNHTIIRNPATGYLVYAVIEEGKLIPSDFVVGEVNPADVGIEPGLNVFPEISQLKSTGIEGIQNAPKTGILNNIVLFIRFLDQAEYTEPISNYDDMFNGNSFSLQGYFNEVSAGQLNISSTYYPAPNNNIVVSYQDQFNRNYYEVYDSITNPAGYSTSAERTVREHTLLENAVNSLKIQIEGSGLDFDSDNDGYVDNICFIVQGSPAGWSELLWPHKWALYSKNVFISGARVWEFNFQLSDVTEVSVLCHEMFHTLGAPDLYHYNGDGLNPVAGWDLMAYDYAQHMTTWMKHKYGQWFNTVPEITANGTYKLPAVSDSPFACFKIPVPESTTEFFMVEYRRKTGYDANLFSTYDEGLLVYRVNTLFEGNAGGPPDELYVLRPEVTDTTLNGYWPDAALSADQNRTILNDNSDPLPILSDSTVTSLSIYDVGLVGDSIEFKVGPASGCTEYNHTDVVSICQGEDYVFGTQILTASGEYTEIFQSVDGCDSTVVLTLTVHPVYNHTDVAAICDGEGYVFGVQNLTASGEYTEIFQSINGCDSTVVLTLTVHPAYNHTDVAAICDGETYIFGTQNL
ncbi:MAG: M6 family metalloprotease domain-containing protein, partial [Gammaproteobacteria bacterium]|nr:M6 family metalloprotease domain-containing protein [Gammaproteobacteria bacterium]